MNKIRLNELLLTAAPFIWLTLFFLVPTLIVYAFSFKSSDLYGGVGIGWTFDAIKSLASKSNVILIYRTLCYSVIATLICLVLAVPVGYKIARSSPKWRQTLLLLIILPFWSSFLVRIFAWKSLLHPEGFLKQLLEYFHIIAPETVLLYHPWTVILVMVYSYIPFAILPIYAAAVKFEEHFFEAAMDLGMTRFKAFFKVFLPCIKNGLLAATLLVLIPLLGAYVIPDVVGGPETEMIGNKIVQKTFVERNIPLASALAALLSLAVLFPFVAQSLLQARVDKAHPIKGGH